MGRSFGLERRTLVALAFVSALWCGIQNANAAPINLVADGGFEPTLAAGYYQSGALGAWTLAIVAGSGGAGIYTPGMFPGTNVTEGNQALDLGMGGIATGNSLSQAIPTVAGQQYQLTFDWGSEYDWGTNSQVTIGTLSAFLIDTPSVGSWIHHSATFAFVAAGNDVLTFTDLSSFNGTCFLGSSCFAGLTLDNVQITAVSSVPPVPEPMTLTLLGVAGLVVRRRRRPATSSYGAP